MVKGAETERGADHSIMGFRSTEIKGPLLTAEQEVRLAHAVRDGDQSARDLLVTANIRLVVTIALKYRKRGLPLNDLVGEGCLGLFDAAVKYDPVVFKTRFSTYASWWIRHAIMRALRDTAHTVRIPYYMGELVAKWSRTSGELSKDGNREPSAEEIADALGLCDYSRPRVAKALKAVGIHRECDCIGEQGFGKYGDRVSLDYVLPSDDGDPGAEMESAEEIRKMIGLLKSLDKRERKIIELRYGLKGEKPHTLREIAAKLRMDRVNVRKIEFKALAKLREKFDAA